MFWPFFLPFQITACIIGGLVAVLTAVAPMVKWRRPTTLLIASGIGLIAFIPSCIGIQSVIDAKRFGVFKYATFDEVDDFRVERYIPPAAKDITLDKYATGFRARYTISEPELMAYLDELWDKYGDHSTLKREESSATDHGNRELLESLFGDLGWPPLDGAIGYSSPTGRNGAGFSVWYSPKEGIAYERAAYW